MQIVRLHIERFRAIRDATIFPTEKNALLGPNNIGKTAILEALHLLLSAHGSSRTNLVDENDFFQRQYASADSRDAPPIIKVEAVLTGLTDHDADLFDGALVPWSVHQQSVVERTEAGTDPFLGAERAVRPCFEAWYDSEDDAFTWLAYHRTDLLLGLWVPRLELARIICTLTIAQGDSLCYSRRPTPCALRALAG